MIDVEIIGYIASVLVAISLTMSKILRLRIINGVGAVAFTIYGYMVGAYPVMFVNAFIVCIDVYYLIKMYQNRDLFDILNGKDNQSYVESFYDHYKDDISSFFPEFTSLAFEKNSVYIIIRNMRPVNLVVFKEQENGIIEIILDYAIPEYRDSLNGKYLLSFIKNIDQVENEKLIVVKSDNRQHIKYLTSLKFKKNDTGLYVLKV